MDTILILRVIFAILFAVSYAEEQAEEVPLVTIEDGSIQGFYKVSTNGRKYASFEGIPYAKPPIGKLRFREPEPAEPWLGTLHASTTYTCIQTSMFGLTGEEDCLYLNVYVPRTQINPEEKLDVIVHIHGGAFMMGSPTTMSEPVHIMDRDVVYVNFNYRLGPFGFYSTSDGIFKGNYGLKDQLLVLKWVQKNIKKFGGNADSVTIIGLSAGGASVHLHYFSPDSKGLFHRGFAQSGVALTPWAVKQDPYINAKKLATEVGCFDESVKVMYQCMKQRSALQIAQGVKKLYVDGIIPLVPFGPATETVLINSFLMSMPYLSLASKQVTDVPLLISVTTEEGTLPSSMFYHRLDELNNNWKYWFPLLLEYYDYDEEKRDKVSEKIREFYFDNEPITHENFGTFVKLCTQRLFNLGAEKAAKMQANATESDVYFLLMGYKGEPVNSILSVPGIDLGVGHGEDGKFYYGYNAGPGFDFKISTEDELRMKDTLVDMLVAFAKTGKPEVKGVDFKPVPKSGNLMYLSVKGPDDMKMKTIQRLGPHEFWRSLELREDENAFLITEKMIEIK